MIYYDFGPNVEAFSTTIADTLPPAGVITPQHQAHSNRVAVIPADSANTHGVDALITATTRTLIGVRTADCVPILVYDPSVPMVAAIHSGWRGTIHHIVPATISRMISEFGASPLKMRAVVGPCIHLKSFEVGDEVHQEFVHAGWDSFCAMMKNPLHPSAPQKWHIDLPGICSHQLYDCGVTKIHNLPVDTFENYKTFYSYRRCGISDRQHRTYTCIQLL